MNIINFRIFGLLVPHPFSNPGSAPAYRAILHVLEVLCNASDPNAMVDPCAIEEREWIDDVTLWPLADFGDICTYLVDTPGEFTRERMMGLQKSGCFN